MTDEEMEVIRLQEKLREALSGALVALMYALGMTLAIMNAADLLQYFGLAAVLLVLVTGVLSAASLDRRAGWLIGGLAAAGGVMWLLMGGFATLLDVLQALALHMSGIRIAMPLVAMEAAVISSVLCGVVSFFITQRSAGPYPALVLLLLTVVLVWLSNRAGLMWCLIPTIVASVSLLLQGSHQISLLRVLPLAVVTVLISFGGVIAGGAVIPPLKETADNVRQRIYDLFLFTGSRDVFSLADIGYYPQGEGQLGGPAEPSTERVMVVITPRKVYLRGVIKNEYTGRSWEDATEGKRYLWDGVGFRTIRTTVFDMDLPMASDLSLSNLMATETVTMRMLSGSASSMFVPQRVRSLKTEGSIVPYFNAGSEIFATRDLALGDVWTVDAPLVTAGWQGLDQLLADCETAQDDNWDAVNRNYRALPEHLEQEIFDIAYAATAGARTPYEAAMALQRFLQANYTYTLEAPEQPTDMDFVSTFLLLHKEGYCTHFASAMTVLCRMAGLPARYVEGYVAAPERVGDQAGMAIVTGEQGHAWTEVYFKGFGWLTFDATPAGMEVAFVLPDEPEDNTPDEPEPTATPEASATPSPTPTMTPVPTATPFANPTPTATAILPEPTATPQPDVPDEAQREPWQFPWWILPVLAAAALIAALVWRIRSMTPARLAARCRTEFSCWLIWTQATHDALRQLGYTRQKHETPMAFLSRVAGEGICPDELAALASAESLMFYGHAVPMPEETQQAEQAHEAVMAVLKRPQRLKMALARAFLPRRRWDITKT